MPATIDYTTEPNLTTLFNTVAINEATLYMGLDPAVAKEFQPADVEKYLLESLHTIETYQASVILQKTVTLDLPYKALCRHDGKIYLPYGVIDSTSVVASFYETTTGDPGDLARTRTAITNADFVTDANYPASLYSDNWSDLTPDIDNEMPLPFRVVYTAGYSSFAELPVSIFTAMKVLSYFTFTNRGESNMELPDAYHHYADQNMLTHREVQEYIL